MEDPRGNSSRPTRSSPRKLKKQEMGLRGRQGGQRLGAPRPGPTPEGEATGPGRGSPASADRGGGGPGPEAEGAEAEGAAAERLGPGGRLRREARGPALSPPPQPTRPPPPPRASLRAPAPELPAHAARQPRTNSPNAPEVANAGRPQSAAARLRRWNRTNPESRRRAEGEGRGRT